jgi:hypothetical protein
MRKIELVVVGPEAPLVGGIVDYFKSDKDLKSVGIIGPNKWAAQLEGSKDFAKAFIEIQYPHSALPELRSGYVKRWTLFDNPQGSIRAQGRWFGGG